MWSKSFYLWHWVELYQWIDKERIRQSQCVNVKMFYLLLYLIHFKPVHIHPCTGFPCKVLYCITLANLLADSRSFTSLWRLRENDVTSKCNIILISVKHPIGPLKNMMPYKTWWFCVGWRMALSLAWNPRIVKLANLGQWCHTCRLIWQHDFVLWR